VSLSEPSLACSSRWTFDRNLIENLQAKKKKHGYPTVSRHTVVCRAAQEKWGARKLREYIEQEEQ